MFPRDIWQMIFQYIDIETGILLSRTCKGFHSVLGIKSRHQCLSEPAKWFRFLAANFKDHEMEISEIMLKLPWIPFKYLLWLKGYPDQYLISAASVTPEYLAAKFHPIGRLTTDEFILSRCKNLTYNEKVALLYKNNWPNWALMEYLPYLKQCLRLLGEKRSFRNYMYNKYGDNLGINFDLYRKYPSHINTTCTKIWSDPTVSFETLMNYVDTVHPVSDWTDYEYEIVIDELLSRDDATMEHIEKYKTPKHIVEDLFFSKPISYLWRNKNLTFEFIKSHVSEYNLPDLADRRDLPVDFIIENLDKLKVHLCEWEYWETLSENLLTKMLPLLKNRDGGFSTASANPKIGNGFFSARLEDINWHFFCMYAHSCRIPFLEKHYDNINWREISWNSGIPLWFKEKNIDKLDWKCLKIPKM